MEWVYSGLGFCGRFFGISFFQNKAFSDCFCIGWLSNVFHNLDFLTYILMANDE